MKNEDKSLEIARLYGICYQNHSKYESDMDSTLECYASAFQMAEWKDRQFKTKIEETFNKLENERYNGRVKSGFEIFKDELMKMMEE